MRDRAHGAGRAGRCAVRRAHHRRWPAWHAVALAALALSWRPGAARAALTMSQRAVVEQYVGALQRHHYAQAFALLTADERRYFGSVRNFASGFEVDRLGIETVRIIGSRRQGRLGTIVLNSERVTFLDFAHGVMARATLTVPYGLIGAGLPRIRDPYHPWRALAPSKLIGQAAGVRITVRKLAFFTGRLEATVNFANLGARTVTLLPYDRSVVRDDFGRAYVPLATRLAGLTDRTLYLGLRLAPDAEYTGLMTFVTPPRFVPTSLTFTFGPGLNDGSDAPFDITLPAFTLASAAP